jgi:hypothetical protein
MYKPLGITVLSILHVILGLTLLFCVAAVTTLTALATAITGYILPAAVGSLAIGGLVIIALFAFGIAYGLYKGKKWAWWLSVIMWALCAVGSLFALGISLVIALAVLAYFFKANVQRYFNISIGWSWGN